MAFLPKVEYELFMNEVIGSRKECFLDNDQSMHYCKCQDVTDAGWPVIEITMGSRVL